MELYPTYFERNGKGFVELDESVFPKNMLVSAAYSLIDKAYFRFESSDEGFRAEVVPKKDYTPEKIVRKLHSELLNFSVFNVQRMRNVNVLEKMFERFEKTNQLEEDESPAPSTEQLMSELKEIYDQKSE